jgi:hypothetical protein
MSGRTVTTPVGEELILLSREEYEDLIDARDHPRAPARSCATSLKPSRSNSTAA